MRSPVGAISPNRSPLRNARRARRRRLAELARTRYREGVVSYLEVLDAERNRSHAEQALLQVRRAEVANLVALYVALGGGVIE